MSPKWMRPERLCSSRVRTPKYCVYCAYNGIWGRAGAFCDPAGVFGRQGRYPQCPFRGRKRPWQRRSLSGRPMHRPRKIRASCGLLGASYDISITYTKTQQLTDKHSFCEMLPATLSSSRLVILATCHPCRLSSSWLVILRTRSWRPKDLCNLPAAPAPPASCIDPSLRSG